MEEEGIGRTDGGEQRSGGVVDGREEDDGNQKSEIYVGTICSKWCLH